MIPILAALAFLAFAIFIFYYNGPKDKKRSS